jgi:exopolyphosphatase/guanosine-5'-triphosphate,3'-diphosphate pyrophosphatase
MQPQGKPGESEVVAFLDMGTNSIRLLLVRINPNHTHTVLSQQREMVRLGDREFADQRLQPEAMHRAVLVCRRFAEMARLQKAKQIVAVATSATREARNQQDFLQLLRREARIEARVISGKEEARLIYLGVSSGLHLGEQRALFVDIGGGSTEVIVGDQKQYHQLETLKLGAIRLTQMFLAGEHGRVEEAKYARMVRHVRNSAVRALQRLRQQRIELAVGSSGTIENLGDIAAQMAWNRRWQRDDVFSRDQLREAIAMLCSLPLAERRKTPGINPERADIILGGAAILDALMQELGLKEIRISDRGLREGLLVDYLARSGHASPTEETSVRMRSVLHLGRICGFDEPHARNVARLALEMFDSARELRLHRLGERERELLEYAALLHDVGAFLSYQNHHAHTYYLIRNADLLGFDQDQIAIVATTGLFHRKSFPRKKHEQFAELDGRSREIVRTLCAFLRIAEALDRSHAGVVRHARFRAPGRNGVVLDVRSRQDCQLELWGAQNQEKAFEKAFQRPLAIEAAVESGAP